jgi:hypothetical protein
MLRRQHELLCAWKAQGWREDQTGAGDDSSHPLGNSPPEGGRRHHSRNYSHSIVAGGLFVTS